MNQYKLTQFLHQLTQFLHYLTQFTLIHINISTLHIYLFKILIIINSLNYQFQHIGIQMKGQESYISTIKSALRASLCLRDFPSVLFEKDNKPYIELSGYSPLIDPFVLKPIYLARNKKEQFLIQPSINSCRVSFTLKKSDQVDKLIAMKFSSMVAARAQLFQLIRRKPVQGYDVTLLITNQILEKYHKDFVIELIINLVSTLEKDLVQVKLNINTQCRIAATYFMEQLTSGKQEEFY